MAQPTTLSNEQLRALGRLKGLLGSQGFYLAGGTAIAYHLGHRQSRDLDFATATTIDLATMKPSALARRGIRRDFWDLYVLLTEAPISLGEALEAYVRRFARTESDIYHVPPVPHVLR